MHIPTQCNEQHTFCTGVARECFLTCSSIYERNAKEARDHPANVPLPPAQSKAMKDYFVSETQPRFSHVFEENNRMTASITRISNNDMYRSQLQVDAAGNTTCSCGMPAITGLPCEHNVYHALQCSMRTEQIVHDKLTTKGWKASYEAVARIRGFGTVSRNAFMRECGACANLRTGTLCTCMWYVTVFVHGVRAGSSAAAHKRRSACCRTNCCLSARGQNSQRPTQQEKLNQGQPGTPG